MLEVDGLTPLPSTGSSVNFVGFSYGYSRPGDYDGDKKTDIAIYETGTGYWYIIPSSTGVPYGLSWGGDPSDIPVSTILPSY